MHFNTKFVLVFFTVLKTILSANSSAKINLQVFKVYIPNHYRCIVFISGNYSGWYVIKFRQEVGQARDRFRLERSPPSS